MLTKLKKKVQMWFTAEAKVAHKIGLTPNMISALGMLLAFLSALTYAVWQPRTLILLLATLLLLLSGFCDVLDGVLARLYHETTVFGGFLDSLLDRYADAVVYTGIISAGLCNLHWGLAALIGSLLVSYSRAKAESAGMRMESIGLAERAERMIILAIASIIATLWQPQTQTIMNSGIILLAIISNLTVLQRSLHVYKKTKEKKLKS